MNFFILIITLLLCNVRGEDCNYCKCEKIKENHVFTCDCSIAMCSQNVYNNGLVISENIKIPSNISSSRIEKIVIHDLPVKSLSFSQKLENLQKLILNSCNTTKIEKNNFQNIETLTQLTIENNNIQEIFEDTFDHVPKLIYINLKNNTIQNIPNRILNKLTNLFYFNLEGNKIQELNSFLFMDNKKIEEIYLNKNSIMELPNIIFKDLSLVTIIDLSNNEIKKLPKGIFRNLNNLKEVNLNNNKIISIEVNAFEDSSNIEKIYLDGNVIKNVNPNILENLPTLTYIDMPASSIDCDCKMKTFFSIYKQRGVLGNIHCSNRKKLSNKFFTDLSIEDFACAPKISYCLEDTKDKVNQIACKIYGDPQPKIMWNLNDTELPENELFDLNLERINEDTYWSNLTIFSKSESTVGLYKIKAQNNGGYNEYTYNLEDQNIPDNMLGNIEAQTRSVKGFAITILICLLLTFVIIFIIVVAIIYLKKYNGVYNLQEDENQDNLLHGDKHIFWPTPTTNSEQMICAADDYKLSMDITDHSLDTDSKHYSGEEMCASEDSKLSKDITDYSLNTDSKHYSDEEIKNYEVNYNQELTIGVNENEEKSCISASNQENIENIPSCNLHVDHNEIK